MADDHTRIGGAAGGAFPTTSWTMIAGARDPEASGYRESLERLASLYWKPVYWTIRWGWKKANEDAKDLTQEFFALFLEKGFASQFDPERGRFRTFLRAALDHFLKHEARAARRQKRGGGARLLSMDGDPELAIEIPDPGKPVEELFDELWMKTLLGAALEQVERSCQDSGKGAAFESFRRFEFAEESPSYEEIARERSLTVHQVRGHLRTVRAQLRAVLRERIRETLADPGLVDDEYRRLFGA